MKLGTEFGHRSCPELPVPCQWWVAELGIPRRVPGPESLQLFPLLHAHPTRDLSRSAHAVETQPSLPSLVSSACPPLLAFISTSTLCAAVQGTFMNLYVRDAPQNPS